MGSARYLARRMMQSLLTIASVVTIVFLLVRLVPGDPVDAILGEEADPEDRAALREALHLDESLPAQYGLFLGDVADLSLGESFRSKDRSVSSLIGEVAGPTIELAFASIAVAWFIGIPLGIIAAIRRREWPDSLASGFAVLGLAVPNILLGPLLIWWLGMAWRLLPLPGDDLSLAALVLPALTVGTALAALLARQTRAAMSSVLREPFMLAAKARGVSGAKLYISHALRNAALPIATIGVAQLGAMLAGAVVTERIFERPGIGTLFLDAFFARDIPVIQGCVIVITTVYVVANLLLDIAYGVIDPRAQVSE